MTNPVKILLGNLKTILSFGSSNANKNVVTDANGDLKVEAKNNHTHANYANPTIADNLTTNDNAQVLSAKQGVELKTLIDSSKVIEIDKNILCWQDFEIFIYENSTEDVISLLNFSDFLNSTDYNGSFTESDIKENTIYLIWYRSTNFSNYQVLVVFKKINNEWFCKYLGTNQYFDINSYALYTHTHSNYLSRYANDLGFVKTNNTYVGFGTTQGTVAEGNHTHSDYVIKETGKGLSTNDYTTAEKNKLTELSTEIIEKIPFYWVDDFLTYASNSHNVYYDPNNDIQYLIDFIDSNDNDSGFTSNDIKTDRLYQIPYGSSYTHDICVAFTYDEVNEEYIAHYVTTNERYATLYELSLKATPSDISSAISTHNSSNSAHSDIRLAIPNPSSTTPSADTTNGSVGSSSNYAKADHQHPLSSAYATSGHTHTYGNITGVSTVQVLVTYTDDTTETLNLLKYTSS